MLKTSSRARRSATLTPPAEAEFLVSTDKQQLDRELIHKFLTESYWAKGIPKQTVDRSIENSLCFGVYQEGQQVGFARVISDFTTYAYIADVFVVEKVRGKGVGKLLMREIRRHPDLQYLRRWSLVTRDAHGLYAQFGFQPVKSPERHMEIHDRSVYQVSRNKRSKR
jgi:N-acetylglutamate synthase-like GNAT family acetyltransferase